MLPLKKKLAKAIAVSLSAAMIITMMTGFGYGATSVAGDSNATGVVNTKGTAVMDKTTTVEISGGEKATVGEEFTVGITFAGKGLTTAQAQVGYDQNALEYIDGGKYGGDGYIVIGGSAEVGEVNVNGDSTVTAYITFKALSKGQTGIDVSSLKLLAGNTVLDECWDTKIVEITDGTEASGNVGSNGVLVDELSEPLTQAISNTDPVITAQSEQDGSGLNVVANDVTYPESLDEGSSFTLEGTLISDIDMTKVETGITDVNGSWLEGFLVTDEPNDTVYDLDTNVDAYIKFGKLPEGTYHYKCVAYAGEETAIVFDYEFTVTGEAVSGLTVTGLTYPTTIGKYCSFTLKGLIKSDTVITKVKIGITKSTGKWLSKHYVTATPNAKKYDISTADAKIKFGNLAVGTYYYKCTVTRQGDDGATITENLFNYKFKVKKNAGIPETKSYGTLSGNQRADIVKIAMAQNGYTSKSENHTAYNLWYYGSDTAVPWCAIFVSWCADRAGVSTSVVPRLAYVPSITAFYQKRSRFNAKKTLPKKGDLIIYGSSSHIGIVAANVTSKSGYVSTIEGNTGNDQVKYRKNYMKWNSSGIKGYCRPKYTTTK